MPLRHIWFSNTSVLGQNLQFSPKEEGVQKIGNTAGQQNTKLKLKDWDTMQVGAMLFVV